MLEQLDLGTVLPIAPDCLGNVDLSITALTPPPPPVPKDLSALLLKELQSLSLGLQKSFEAYKCAVEEDDTLPDATKSDMAKECTDALLKLAKVVDG